MPWDTNKPFEWIIMHTSERIDELSLARRLLPDDLLIPYGLTLVGNRPSIQDEKDIIIRNLNISAEDLADRQARAQTLMSAHTPQRTRPASFVSKFGKLERGARILDDEEKSHMTKTMRPIHSRPGISLAPRPKPAQTYQPFRKTRQEKLGRFIVDIDDNRSKGACRFTDTDITFGMNMFKAMAFMAGRDVVTFKEMTDILGSGGIVTNTLNSIDSLMKRLYEVMDIQGEKAYRQVARGVYQLKLPQTSPLSEQDLLDFLPELQERSKDVLKRLYANRGQWRKKTDIAAETIGQDESALQQAYNQRGIFYRVIENLQKKFEDKLGTDNPAVRIHLDGGYVCLTLRGEEIPALPIDKNGRKKSAANIKPKI